MPGAEPAGGMFRADLDRLPQLRADLEAVRARYQDILAEARTLRRIQPGGGDEVSVRAAGELSQLAGDAPGQLGWCAAQARDRMDEVLGQIDAILAGYRTAEDRNTMRV